MLTTVLVILLISKIAYSGESSTLWKCFRIYLFRAECWIFLLDFDAPTVPLGLGSIVAFLAAKDTPCAYHGHRWAKLKRLLAMQVDDAVTLPLG